MTIKENSRELALGRDRGLGHHGFGDLNLRFFFSVVLLFLFAQEGCEVRIAVCSFFGVVKEDFCHLRELVLSCLYTYAYM